MFVFIERKTQFIRSIIIAKESREKEDKLQLFLLFFSGSLHFQVNDARLYSDSLIMNHDARKKVWP